MSSRVNVDSWEIPLFYQKCGIENEVTLWQIKKGATIQCVVCAIKISLKDKGGSVEKGTKQVQDAIDSLEKTAEKLGGSLKVK